MKKQSLVYGFRMTVTWIAVASIAATLITWLLAATLYLKEQNKSIYPANYYEQQIPKIDEYVRRENTNLLLSANENRLQNAIKGDGISYQVVDGKGNILYGTNKEKIFIDKTDLISHLNTNSIYKDKGTYLYVVPITGKEGKIEGAVALTYQLKLSYGNGGGRLVMVVIVAALFSPILYIILFTLLFTRLFVKRINLPLQLLMDASKKIKNKDLDFEVNYHSENELGKLCIAFTEMQEELKKSLSAQWKMEQERIEMVEVLAHDLKTPISIVLGYTESLLDTGITNQERVRRYLSVIEENAQKCSILVQQMQAASESEQTNYELKLVSMNLYDFLSQKVKHYELQAEENGISIELQADSSTKASYLLDTDKLERIFDNIISNSLRYTPADGKIIISAIADKEHITYHICDTGSGFSKKDLEKATERFYRCDEARQSGTGHSGLGLYIVKRLVKQLYGTVTITNNKENGACVTFSQKVFSQRET